MAEPERAEGIVAARSMADAAALLARKYTLVTTNVPFLGGGKQSGNLSAYISHHYPDTTEDLSVSIFSRIMEFVGRGGSIAAVTPQNWLFLYGYKNFRGRILRDCEFKFVAALGSRAFETISGSVVNAALVIITAQTPEAQSIFFGLDANKRPNPQRKIEIISQTIPVEISQYSILQQKDKLINFIESNLTELLENYSSCHQGTSTGDADHKQNRLGNHCGPRKQIKILWRP
jgi:hypothetical protein